MGYKRVVFKGDVSLVVGVAEIGIYEAEMLRGVLRGAILRVDPFRRVERIGSIVDINASGLLHTLGADLYGEQHIERYQSVEALRPSGHIAGEEAEATAEASAETAAVVVGGVLEHEAGAVGLILLD